MWPGFKSRRQRYMWVEFVVGSLPCTERFFSWYSGFPLSSKTNTSKFQFDLERTDTFQRVHKNFMGKQITTYKLQSQLQLSLIFVSGAGWNFWAGREVTSHVIGHVICIHEVEFGSSHPHIISWSWKLAKFQKAKFLMPKGNWDISYLEINFNEVRGF